MQYIPAMFRPRLKVFLALLLMVGGWAVPAPALSPSAREGSLDGQWLIEVPAGMDPRDVARAAGAQYAGPLRGVDGYHRIRFFEQLENRPDLPDLKKRIARTLKTNLGIRAFEEEEVFIRYPRAFNPRDPRFPEQWHLENVGQSGGLPFSDARVRPAWDSGLSGQNVTIAIVDEGTEFRHPDLLPNWYLASGYDYNDEDTDPSPSGSDDRHGTAVAGISLAASNGIGGLGIAYNARLIPLRLIAGPFESGKEAEALSYRRNTVDVYNNSWGPSDEAGVRYADSSGVLKAALEDNVQFGRSGLGNIYVWAAGNGGLNGDNSNFDGYNSLPYTISVGALGHDDIKTGYSEPGANLLVVAPSGGRGGGILTTDNTGFSGYSSGDVYENFSGTSAAAPMVSGVVALMLEARPDLNWRDVQQILALTAVPVDFSDDKWARNGAGLWVSHDYGFGRVDASAAVELARNWQSLGPMDTVFRQQARTVTLDFGQIRSGSFTITEAFEVQFVRIGVQFNHSDWGDLRVELISPQGTRSVLSEPHPNANASGEPGSWTYLSTRHLGEMSNGEWRLEVTDDGGNGSGSWQTWSLTLMGHPLSAESNRRPQAEDLFLQSTDWPVEIDVLFGVTDPDGDPLEILSVQYPTGGMLEEVGEGRFSYRMGEAPRGTDTFSVLIGDGKGGAKRRLVQVLDPRPVARNDLYPVLAGSTIELPVLSNDLDPDADPMRLVGLSGSYLGSATLQENGTILYTAPSRAGHVDRIRYHLSDDSDGESTGWATVVVQASSDVSLEFDGVDDFMRIPPTTEITLSNRFTVEAWIYPESWGEYVTGFGRIYDRNTFVFFLNGFDHSFYNDRSLVAYFITSDGRAIAANSVRDVLVLDKWQHVALTYDTSDLVKSVRMYVDGREVGLTYPLPNTAAPRFPVSDNRGEYLYMGETENGARAFKGKMTEFRIWNRVLSPATLQLQHDRRLTGNESGLQLYLPLNQSLGPQALSNALFKGSAEIFEARRVPPQLPWDDLVARYSMIQDPGNGWWLERTLGWLYGDAFPWVYLQSLEWVYTGHGSGGTNYLLYPVRNNWGWLSTNPILYPWIYRIEGQSWMWYVEGTYQPALFYDSVLGWISDEDEVPPQ